MRLSIAITSVRSKPTSHRPSYGIELDCSFFWTLLHARRPDNFLPSLPSREKVARFGSKFFVEPRRVYTDMKFSDISIDFFENTSSEPAFLHGIMRLNAGARIVKSTIRGPLFLNKNSQIGPDVVDRQVFRHERELLRCAGDRRRLRRHRRAYGDQSVQPSDRAGSASTSSNIIPSRSTGSRNTTTSCGSSARPTCSST